MPGELVISEYNNNTNNKSGIIGKMPHATLILFNVFSHYFYCNTFPIPLNPFIIISFVRFNSFTVSDATSNNQNYHHHYHYRQIHSAAWNLTIVLVDRSRSLNREFEIIPYHAGYIVLVQSGLNSGCLEK